jgi:hypothetical protein
MRRRGRLTDMFLLRELLLCGEIVVVVIKEDIPTDTFLAQLADKGLPEVQQRHTLQ